MANTKNVTTVAHMFDQCTNARRILLGNQFDTKNVTDVSYMFNNCRVIRDINLGPYFDTRNVTDMSYMLCNCENLTYFDTGGSFYTYKVRDFSYMFYNIRVNDLHFNSRFAIKSNYPYLDDHEVPLATNMMHYALDPGAASRYRNVYMTRATYDWLRSAASGANWDNPGEGWGTVGLPQIVLPTD